MKTTGNCILITGGASGIGRGLAERYQHVGNRVVIAGRRKDLLEEVVARNPGMSSVELETTSKQSITSAAEQIRPQFPMLNVVIANAGFGTGRFFYRRDRHGTS